MSRNREEQLALIRERCFAANPAIKELAFGCRVRLRRTRADVVVVFVTWAPMSSGEKFYGLKDGGGASARMFRVAEIGVTEGRPICLCDVLLAIGATRQTVACDGRGNLFRVDPAGGALKPGVSYDLHRDTVDEQSDDCIAFIADLLNEAPDRSA